MDLHLRSRVGSWKRVICRFLGHEIEVFRPLSDRPFRVVRGEPPLGFVSRCARCTAVWNRRQARKLSVSEILGNQGHRWN